MYLSYNVIFIYILLVLSFTTVIGICNMLYLLDTMLLLVALSNIVASFVWCCCYNIDISFGNRLPRSTIHKDFKHLPLFIIKATLILPWHDDTARHSIIIMYLLLSYPVNCNWKTQMIDKDVLLKYYSFDSFIIVHKVAAA